MFHLINRLLGFVSELFETNPNQNGATDMISHYSSFATLAPFDAGQLLGFAMKLLDLPAKAAHVSYDLQVVLRYLVGHDIVRALGRQHYSENFHLVFRRKAFDFDHFTLLQFGFRPFQAVHSPIGL